MSSLDYLGEPHVITATTAKSLQSCLTLCDPTDSSPPGSPVPGILQARTLEWVAISFSNAWKWKLKVKSLSRVRLFTTPWTAANQAPPSMGFSRQEYWSWVPLPSPELKWTYVKLHWISHFKYVPFFVPHLYIHETVNEEAQNEWLQAVFPNLNWEQEAPGALESSWFRCWACHKAPGELRCSWSEK